MAELAWIAIEGCRPDTTVRNSFESFSIEAVTCFIDHADVLRNSIPMHGQAYDALGFKSLNVLFVREFAWYLRASSETSPLAFDLIWTSAADANRV